MEKNVGWQRTYLTCLPENSCCIIETVVLSALLMVCLKRIISEGLLLTYSLCCSSVLRGDSVSASHCGHSTRSSGDTSTVTWDYSDPELSGLFHGLHRMISWLK